jgi:hypothetical protein
MLRVVLAVLLSCSLTFVLGQGNAKLNWMNGKAAASEDGVISLSADQFDVYYLL